MVIKVRVSERNKISLSESTVRDLGTRGAKIVVEMTRKSRQGRKTRKKDGWMDDICMI